jgi:hypothetical protein
LKASLPSVCLKLVGNGIRSKSWQREFRLGVWQRN